ncbi:MAG TPA: response regulator [Verrucomicrobiae bacterium]|jgi:CheY-like chemotaxis protein
MSENFVGNPERQDGKRILIVEDDAVVAQVYQRRLTKAGFRVAVASEGSEGFISIVKDKPDGILLDLMLPQMDGLQILRKTRAQKQFERTPIIVFSNAFMNGMLQDAAACGATMTVNKSEPNAITSIVEAFLQYLCRAPVTQFAAPPASKAAQETDEPAPPSQFSEQPGRQVAEQPQSPKLEGQAAIPAVSGPVTGRRFGVFPLARTRANQVKASSEPAPTAARVAKPTLDGLSRGNLGSIIGGRRLPPAESIGVDEEDRSAERDILNVFFDGGTETIAAVRNALRDYQKAPSTPQGREHLEAFYGHVHRLTGIAAMCSSESISNFTACLEALVHELVVKPDSFRPSTLKTLAMAVDVLSRMFKEAGRYECPMISQAMVLVVDDDVVSQKAITLSLEKARLHAMCATDAASALDQIRQILFELIFLEAAIPNVDGFELCSTIRQMPGYEHTPIIFVTGLTDFQSRARSVTSGGNEFISKPLCRIEMTVKALTFVMKGRMAGATLNSPIPT